jgi:transposase
VLALPLPLILATEVRVLVDQIRSLTGSIAELEELIEEEGPKLAGHKNLISIKGIGSVSATVRLSAIGKIDDFAQPGKLAAYFGLVPRVQNSNETERSGRICKQGNKLARTALVQCSLIAIQSLSAEVLSTYPAPSRRWQTNIALARKFLGVIYHTLKNNWVFEDFPNFVMAS